jgi:hypothetical protein
MFLLIKKHFCGSALIDVDLGIRQHLVANRTKNMNWCRLITSCWFIFDVDCSKLVNPKASFVIPFLLRPIGRANSPLGSRRRLTGRTVPSSCFLAATFCDEYLGETISNKWEGGELFVVLPRNVHLPISIIISCCFSMIFQSITE